MRRGYPSPSVKLFHGRNQDDQADGVVAGLSSLSEYVIVTRQQRYFRFPFLRSTLLLLALRYPNRALRNQFALWPSPTKSLRECLRTRSRLRGRTAGPLRAGLSRVLRQMGTPDDKAG